MTLLDIHNPDNKFIMASPELRGMIVNHGMRMIENGYQENTDLVIVLIEQLEKLKYEKNQSLTI